MLSKRPLNLDFGVVSVNGSKGGSFVLGIFLNRQGSERSSDFWNWCILSPDFVAIQFAPTAVQKPAPHRPLSSHAFRIPRSQCQPRPDLLWVRRPYQCPAQPLGWFQLICSCVDLWFFSSGVSSLWTIAQRKKLGVEFCSRFLNFNGLLYFPLYFVDGNFDCWNGWPYR